MWTPLSCISLFCIPVRKGRVNTPCLAGGLCTDPNTVCSQQICVCSQQAVEKEGLCGEQCTHCTVIHISLLNNSQVLLFSDTFTLEALLIADVHLHHLFAFCQIWLLLLTGVLQCTSSHRNIFMYCSSSQ